MWVKICGVRDVETARLALRAGADAIGLNFYRPSPRSIDWIAAREIVTQLPSPQAAVGLFVNHPLEEILAAAADLRLSTVQLHGDETPDFLRSLHAAAPQLRIIRALRVGEAGLAPVQRYLDECREFKVPLAACLLDAQAGGLYGGSGRTLPWKAVQGYRRDAWPPLILAGGLTPENVAEAIREVRPWGVDTASGVETSHGVKDPERVQQFVSNARAAQS